MPLRLAGSDDGCCCGVVDVSSRSFSDERLVPFADKWEADLSEWTRAPTGYPTGLLTTQENARVVRKHVCEEMRWGSFNWRSVHPADELIFGLYDYDRKSSLWVKVWFEVLDDYYYYTTPCLPCYLHLIAHMEIHLTRGSMDSVLRAVQSQPFCMSESTFRIYGTVGLLTLDWAYDPRNHWAMFRVSEASTQIVWPREIRAVVHVPEDLRLGTPFFGTGELHSSIGDGTCSPSDSQGFAVSNWQLVTCLGIGTSDCNYESANCDGKCLPTNPWMRPVYGQAPDGPPEFEVEITGLAAGAGALGSVIPGDVLAQLDGNYSLDLSGVWDGWYQPVWEMFPAASWNSGVITIGFGEGDNRELRVSVFACVDSTATKRYVWVFFFAQFFDGNALREPIHLRVFRHAWRREIPFSKSVAELQDFVLDHREPQCVPLYPGIDNDYIDWSQSTCRISAILPASA